MPGSPPMPLMSDAVGVCARAGDPWVPLAAAAKLLRALDVVELAPAPRDAAVRDLAGLDAELRRAQPDAANVAGHLERLTRVLRDAGALVTPGAVLAGPLGAIARWAGPPAVAVLALLA